MKTIKNSHKFPVRSFFSCLWTVAYTLLCRLSCAHYRIHWFSYLGMPIIRDLVCSMQRWSDCWHKMNCFRTGITHDPFWFQITHAVICSHEFQNPDISGPIFVAATQMRFILKLNIFSLRRRKTFIWFAFREIQINLLIIFDDINWY